MGDELLLLWAGGIIGFLVGCLVTTLLRTRHYVILPPRRRKGDTSGTLVPRAKV